MTDQTPALERCSDLVFARRIVDAVTEYCRGADFSCDMKAATKQVLSMLNQRARPSGTSALADEGRQALLVPGVLRCAKCDFRLIKTIFMGLVAWATTLHWKQPHKSMAGEFIPADTFECSACGSGPWHASWSPEFNPPLCPNCTGAD